MQVQSLSWEDPQEKGMATHPSILAWRIPWTGEHGELQSTGSQRVRHDWVTEQQEWGCSFKTLSFRVISTNTCSYLSCKTAQMHRICEMLVAQSCPTPCNPMDWDLPASSVHGILQARILEWVAISFSMEPKKNDTNELIYKRNT